MDQRPGQNVDLGLYFHKEGRVSPTIMLKNRFWTDVSRKLLEFCIDFGTEKSVSKRVRRKASRRLLFDVGFDDGFVDSSRFSVEFAFSLVSRNVWFYLGKSMIFATSLG